MTDPKPSNQPGAGPDPVAPTTTPPAPASDPKVQTDPTAADFDPSKLSDEQFAAIYNDPRLFKHERFKSLNDRAKKADEYETAQADAENKKLEEEKKFEELTGKLKSENETLKAEKETMKVDFALQNALMKEKVIDPEAALKLVDRSQITVDKDGNVEGADKAIEALKTGKPYLFGEGGTTSLGTPAGNPAGEPASGKKFKLSQVQDPTFFQANKDEILKAWSAGNIENDVTGAR